MTLPIKSILNCLVILAMPSNIYTDSEKQMRESGSSQELAKGLGLIWGSGAERSHLPMFTYILSSTSLQVSIYIQPPKKCDFTFQLGKDIEATTDTIKQLGGNKVAFLWSKLYDDTDEARPTISIFDMDSCANTKNLEYEWYLNSNNMLAVVPFADSFDVITSKNSHERYDTNGNIIGKTESFPINSCDFSVSPVSETSSMNGFFIADHTSKELNLVKSNGKISKTLLTSIPETVFSNNEQSLYSVCSFDVNILNVVNCFQYSEIGIKIWNNKVTLGYAADTVDLKNLEGGGLVFAAWKSKNNKLYVVEMGPQQSNIWSYSAKYPFKAVRLMEFNKDDNTLILAYTQIVPGVYDESAVSQQFSFDS